MRDLAVGLAAEDHVEVEVADDLDERPVGDPVAVGQAAALEHERVRRRAIAISSAASRDLPTPGSPTIVTTRQARSASDALELGQQRVELRGAPDERRVHPARDAGRVRLDVEQAPGVDGLGLPLQLERRHRLGGDGVADEPDRRVADEDLAGRRRRLEPLRDDDGVAGGERIALRGVAGVDLARMDAGAHADPDPERPLQLVVQAGELAAELDGRAHGAKRVVLVHDRDPEDGEHGVADELLDRAAVALEHRPRSLVIARPDAPERLRVELLAERRRVRDVAEDERDRLPDHKGECRPVFGPCLEPRTRRRAGTA